jgi:NAD(P)-dependent dehydrogenase (short-subunit alcohol dehydrogenase family)
MRLEGKVVIVTGASAGIGRATALELARRGAKVGLIARGRERLESARQEIEQAGGTAATAVADVSDHQALERATSELEARLGPLDAWVNNAMAAVLAEVADTSPEEFKRVTEVTYLGSVHGTGIALRRFLPRNRGTIVQVGSALSRRGIPLQASYCGAKHALEGFLESLRAELRHRHANIHVSLGPVPGVNTPQFDWVRTRLRRIPQPVPADLPAEVAARRDRRRRRAPAARDLVGGPTVLTIVGNTGRAVVVDRYLAARTSRPSRPARSSGRPPGQPVGAPRGRSGARTGCSTTARRGAARSTSSTTAAGRSPRQRCGGGSRRAAAVAITRRD